MRRPAAIVALSALLLAATLRLRCAPAAQAVRPSPGVLLAVPFVRQQKPNGCGAASLSMVIRYWDEQMHRAHSPRADLASIERTLDPRDHGITNTDLAAYLEAAGFRVFAFAGRWDDLRGNLSEGRPLVVGLAPRGSKGPLHYVVVAGIDWERDYVFLDDPAERPLFRMTRTRFLTEWKVTGNWTLLAVPKPRV